MLGRIIVRLCLRRLLCAGRACLVPKGMMCRNGYGLGGVVTWRSELRGCGWQGIIEFQAHGKQMKICESLIWAVL